MDDEGSDQVEGPATPSTPSTPPAGFTPPSTYGPPPSFEAPPSFEPPAPGTPPTFEPAPGFATQPGTTDPFADGPSGPVGATMPPAPPDPLVPPMPPVPPAWKRLIAPSEPVEGPRPAPTLTSMVAVGGGLLAAAGLVSLLGELDGYDQRTTGLAISLLFVALGVAISVLNRSSRAAAGGVALSILGVIPFTAYVFANANLFDLFNSSGTPDGDPWDGIRWTVTLMLGTAAALWLLGYLFVPTRRFGAFLGAALLALWLIPIFNLQLSAVQDAFSPFGGVSTFEPVPSPDFNSGFDDPSLDDFDSQFGDDFTYEEPKISDPSTKMGMASLAIGAVYLAFAAWRDRKGDARMATAALAPAVIVLFYANSVLTGHIGWVGSGLLAIVVGAIVLAVGLRGGRRASSWIGMFLATVGLGSLVLQGLGDSPRAVGAVLTVLGVVLALGVGLADRRKRAPSDPVSDPTPSGPTPFDPSPLGGPTAAVPGSPSEPAPSPWSQTF